MESITWSSRASTAALMAIVMLTLTSCATIVSKAAYQVSIDSRPEGAMVKIEDETGAEVYRSETPAVVTLEAGGGYFVGKRYRVTIAKAGYEVRTISIESTIDGWYWGNLLLGGLIGMLIVDPVTGAMWTLNPQDIDVALVESPQAGGMRIYDIEDIPARWRPKLRRLEGV